MRNVPIAGRYSATVILRRIVIWLLETSCEALLTGLLLFAVAWVEFHRTAPGNTRFVHDLLGLSVAVAFMFFMTGYLLTTVIFRTVWNGRKLWSYSVISAVLFLIHFEILNRGVGGAFDLPERTLIRVVGPCIAFACTLGGSWLLSKVHVRRVAESCG